MKQSQAMRIAQTILVRLDTLQCGEWSLETIADDIEADLVYAECPPRILAMIVIDQRGSVCTIAQHIRDTAIEAVVTARCLASVMAVRAKSLPTPRVITIDTDFWIRNPQRGPLWGAAIDLCVSRDDLASVLSGEATPEQIADRRGVPPWFVYCRFLSEILHERIDGDVPRVLAEMSHARRRFLAWIMSELRGIQVTA